MYYFLGALRVSFHYPISCYDTYKYQFLIPLSLLDFQVCDTQKTSIHHSWIYIISFITPCCCSVLFFFTLLSLLIPCCCCSIFLLPIYSSFSYYPCCCSVFLFHFTILYLITVCLFVCEFLSQISRLLLEPVFSNLTKYSGGI